MHREFLAHPFSFGRCLFGIFVAALLAFPAVARSADATFVGILALAAEDDVANQLGLNAESRTKLIDLINRREREALNLALELKDLPPSEAAKRLEPFVAESERLGFELMTVAQRGKLQQVRVARAGMMSLLEPNIAQVVSLSADQQKQLADLAKQRSSDLGSGGETQRRLTNAMYERTMAAVLSESQRATWEQLAGLSAGPAAGAIDPNKAVAQADPASSATEPATEEPAAEKPAAQPPVGDSDEPAKPVTETPDNDRPSSDPSAPADTPADEPTKPAAQPPAPNATPPAPETPDDSPTSDAKPEPMPAESPMPTETSTPSPAPVPMPEPAPPADTTPQTETAPPAETTIRPASRAPNDDRLRFSFVHTPWADVIEWFADEAGLALQRDTMPAGTFNYTDPRSYTPAEALDLMNSILLTKGYTLLRRNNMLLVIDLENEIPPELIELVPLEELDQRGSYELVKTLFQLARMTPEQAESDIGKMIGPQGKVIVMPAAQQVLVQETAGKLRTIRAMIERVEDPTVLRNHKIEMIDLKNVAGEELMQIARPLLGLGEDQNSGTDISVSIDPIGTRLFVSGSDDMLQRLDQIVKMVDKPYTPSGDAVKPVEQPFLQTYTIEKATPDTALSVLQTLLAGLPDVRMAIDPATNKLIAFGRPSDHQTIVATLKQLAGQADKFEVIQLRRVDPEVIVLMAQKFFGGGATEEGAATTGPVIDGDPIAMQLYVRGSEEQLAQVKELVEKLEGTTEGDEVYGESVRILPFTGRTARAAVEQAEFFWPAMQRPNRIRVVTPSAITPSLDSSIRMIPRTPGESPMNTGPFNTGPMPGEPAADGVPATESSRPVAPRSLPARDSEARRSPVRNELPSLTTNRFAGNSRLEMRFPAQRSSRSAKSTPEVARTERTLTNPTLTERAPVVDPAQVRFQLAQLHNSRSERGYVRFVSDEGASDQGAAAAPARDDANANEPGSNEPPKAPAANSPATPANPAAGPVAEIIVSITPTGIIIASEDKQALDEFERQLRSIVDSTGTTSQEPVIFWLKFAKAEPTAALLRQILGASGGATDAGGGSLLGDMASSMLGDVGGGLVGSLLGGGGGATFTTSGDVSIVADNRLNALIVQANAADLDLIEQLLQVFDTEASPEEVQTYGKPRLIPVIYTSADEVATVVRGVYASRIAGAESQNNRQPTPQDFIQALRGGGGGRGGRGGGEQGSEEPKMAISVDKRSNSLIVTAPEPLFLEVKELVETIDQAGLNPEQTYEVVKLDGNLNSEVIQRALISILGPSVTTSTTTSSSSTPGNSAGQTGGGGGGDNQPNPDDIRRR
ncbi:MAG: hypothetical protein KDA71_22630, partial [Planctomycetales bacterium]|nr:hypothetical protein [Planctomycetales bacterium]